MPSLLRYETATMFKKASPFCDDGVALLKTSVPDHYVFTYGLFF